VCIDETILDRNAHLRLPYDFDMASLPDLAVVIEELSHFNTFCSAALINRPLSPLDLEIQGEVDKFAVVLDWLHERNEESLKDQIYDLMFGKLNVGTWVHSKDRQLYEEAHQISKNFIRKVLGQSKCHQDSRLLFREFFAKSPSEKLKLTV